MTFKNVIVGVGERQGGRDAIALAELHRAGLLVVGATSRGLIGRALIGDDTRDALNGAPCALAVATKLAAHHGALVSAFQAVSLPAYPFGGVATGAAAGVDESINNFVEDARELRLLIVGSRSHGPVGRLVHGSVPRQLARTARCPLLVLTRVARADGGRRARSSALPPRAGARWR